MSSQGWRWLALVPAAIGVWYAALVAGIATVELLERLCPAEQRVSGACTAPWFAPTVDALVVVYSAVSALLVVCTAHLVAPRRKRAVAWIAFGAGGVTAVMLGLASQAWAAMAAALAAGAAAASILSRKAMTGPPHGSAAGAAGRSAGARGQPSRERQ